MIFFTCNYCDELELIPIGDNNNIGQIIKITCKKCNNNCYLKVSRIDPESWKQEDMIVNEETKEIRVKE